MKFSRGKRVNQHMAGWLGGVASHVAMTTVTVAVV